MTLNINLLIGSAASRYLFKVINEYFGLMYWMLGLISSEAVARRCTIKQLYSKISQNSQKNTCVRVFFLSKVAGLFAKVAQHHNDVNWYRFGFFTVDFEQIYLRIQYINLVFLFITLNINFPARNETSCSFRVLWKVDNIITILHVLWRHLWWHTNSH